LRPEVLAAMLPWLGLPAADLDRLIVASGERPLSPSLAGFGNANALYAEGKAARQALEAARASLAAAVGAKPTEIVFTSGGTEADAAAIAGIVAALRARKGKAAGDHIICSAFEHRAVAKAVLRLKAQGFQTTMLKPRADGFIHPDDLAAALRPETLLVSVMLVQNEIGCVQPVAALAALAHEAGALFHCDAVQALGKLPININDLSVDAASFSAHKIGGPKGSGALYLRDGTAFEALQKGGGQEGGRRGGTQDVASATGFATAAQIACEPAYLQAENARLAGLRDRLAAGLLAADPRVALSVPVPAGDVSQHASGICSLLIDGQQSEMLVLRLDEAGIAASGGSACAAGSLEPSHVLSALGIGKRRALGALRLSLGWASREADVEALLAAFPSILSR
jgi:cysteine desulfurase